MKALPTGTVTFVFTDIEGSTRLIQRLGSGHREVLETHTQLLRKAISEAGGIEVGERGDGFFFVFVSACDAARAAAQIQRSLAEHSWPPGGTVRVRIGMHTGEGVLGGDNYMGLEVHRAARVGTAGHGGQVILSEATATLLRDSLPTDLSLRDLGCYRLKDLPQKEQLFQLLIPGLPADFPPPRTLGFTHINLPHQLTSFVGRRRELEEVLQGLTVSRLLTLTGPGGTGKTRLSLQAAAEVAPGFPDGVFFVPLAPITDPELVVPTILSSLNLPPAKGDPFSSLREYLESRRILLVLDNFEQILSAGHQVGDWLRAAPGLKVLVTSRAPLRVYGEREYSVPPLDMPDPTQPTELAKLAESEAVTLFVDRASAARPDFALSEQNASTIAEIVTRLDGLPLAIELAASRVKLMPPQTILDRLSSRLALLTGGARDLPARQQTLRGAIAWSYELLEEPVRQLFRRLSIFVGGACLPELEAVCGPDFESGVEVLDALAVLVDHSLVKQRQLGTETHISMLETIREFANELLVESGELDQLEERHTEAFLALAESAEPNLVRKGRRRWLDRLEADVDNLRTALSRLITSGEIGSAQRMVGILWRFWQVRGYIKEGRKRAAEVLSHSGGEPAQRVSALFAAGGMAYWQGDMETMKQMYAEALELARELNDPRTLALALYNNAFPTAMHGTLEEGKLLLEEGLAVAEELGDSALIGEILWGFGTIYWFVGEHQAGEPWYDRALEALQGSDSVFVVGWAHHMRGLLRTEKGDFVGAREDLRTSMSLFAEDDDLSGIVLSLNHFAALALAEDDVERALRLAAAAAKAEEVSETGMLEVVQNRIPGLTQADARVGRERAEELLAEGRAMPLKQAVAYALETPEKVVA
ncbi:MAG: adenylate/guanylate cyclase domain-containing protein [Spirochaetaceae bacterium]|nr:MAG: adenylate/guanylate cyclase domain-containing protein [Spirochaetaceae bacterium]